MMIVAALAALLLQAKPADRELQGIAAKCGSEIPWLDSLSDAQKAALAGGKPIAWWVTRVETSPMDRKVVLEKYMQAGPFMMPGAVDLLSNDFVPLKLAGNPAIHRKYGIQVIDFIEPGIVFLSPDLKVIHRVDRLTAYS